jgi:hypothetical protein
VAHGKSGKFDPEWAFYRASASWFAIDAENVTAQSIASCRSETGKLDRQR